MGIDGVGDQLGLAARELRGRHALLDHLRDHRVGGGFELRQGYALARRAVDAELRQIHGVAFVPGAGGDRDVLVDHQAVVQPAVVAGAEDMGEHLERGRFAGLGGGIGRHQIAALHHRLLDARVGERERAHRHRRRLLRPMARHDVGVTLELAVGLLGELEGGLRFDVAGDHHDRVVGTVEATIEADGVVAREPLHLVAPADHRLAVGAVEVERGVDLLAELRARIVAHALVLLLEDDLKLGPHDLVGELQAGHAVGFERHHGLELFARHALVKGRVVVGGEGVFLTAAARDHVRELAGRMLGGALEHQMFEEMRQPRFARRLVGGADLVPDHVGNHRRAVIGNDDQLEAVGQREVGDLAGGLVGGGKRRRRKCHGDGRRGGHDDVSFEEHVGNLQAQR